MRFDSIGLFWQDEKREKTAEVRHMPSIPDTGWKPPQFFPNLSTAKVISLDTETFDPELLTHGAGWARNKGHVIGVSIGAIDAQGNSGNWYFPMRHEICPEDNMDVEAVLCWLRDALSDPSIPKVGANLQYDIGWLRHEGVEVKGDLVDVQFAEALLDESARVGLDVLGKKYLDEGKESNQLYEWLSDWFGGAPTGKQRKWMYKAPPCLVGPYAESDADLPLRLARVFYPLLEKEGLMPVFKMECGLIRLMVDMRYKGVAVDVDKAQELGDKFKSQSGALQRDLNAFMGFEVNVEAPSSLKRVFETLGLKSGTTAKGNPSYTDAVLSMIDHQAINKIQEIRKIDKLRGTFVESYILNSHVDGRVYGSFHQLRGDAGGTRSGRFSASSPNLQNIPSRDDILAPMVRGLFIPDKGHECWRKYDYSQVEYRMLINHAVGQAGHDIRAYFKKHPDTDYHVYAQEVVQKATGVLIERKPIKNINFGLIYGMGVQTLAEGLKMSKKEAKSLVDAYFKGVPFAKPTMDAVQAAAQKTGVVKTVLGRRSRFDMWEPSDYKDRRPALPRHLALEQYGGDIKRAYTHKALNRQLQGGSADLMKMAMLKCYEGGVFDATGVPCLTVHDELDFSDAGGADEAFEEMRHLMETALPLDVPIKADVEKGPDWGHVK